MQKVCTMKRNTVSPVPMHIFSPQEFLPMQYKFSNTYRKVPLTLK